MKIRIGECKHCKGDLLLKQLVNHDIFWQCLQCGRIIETDKIESNKLAGV